MVTRKLHLLVLLCFITISSTLQAQKIIRKADKQFELRAYQQAMKTYQDALTKYPDNNILTLQIAECLRRTNQVLESKEWYEIAMSKGEVPTTYNLYYGHLLKSIGDYDNAAKYYEQYKVVDPAVAEHYMVSCDFAKNLMEEQSDYELLLEECNSDMSDLAPKFYGEDIVFTSFRENDSEAEIHGCKLYTKRKGVESRALRSPLQSQMGLGFITYAKDIELCAFSRSNMKNNHEPVAERDEDHSIYLAQVIDGGDFVDDVPFKYNEVNSSTAFPHLAFDGKALYFSSNRKGGFGGYDLYVSYLKDGDWTAPENLGASINSVGNEISPFFDGKILFFASDFHAGMGGYDIFQSAVVMGEWTYPINLGNGINSPGDDYFPAINQSSKKLYFSSNRLGGRGGDDIYYGIPSKEAVIYSIADIYNTDRIPSAIKLNSDYVSTTLDGPMPNIAASEANTSHVQLVGSEKTTIRVLSYDDIDEMIEQSESEEQVDNSPIVEVEDTAPNVSSEVLTLAGEHHNLEIVEDIYNVEFNTTPVVDEIESRDIFNVVLLPSIGCSCNSIHGSDLVLAANFVVPVSADYDAISEDITKAVAAIQVDQNINTNEAPAAKKLITEVPGSRSISKDISMTGAHRVSYGDLLPAVDQVYFIQLASLTQSRGNVADYKSLIKYGNIYKMYKTYSTKIKLGYFIDKSEAERVLKNVKAQGFRDAFITTDPLQTGEMELFIAGKEYDYNGSNYSTPRTEGTKFKVRLASYEDPIWFDIKSAKELGEIEQWTKGEWTIFILSGFRDQEEAHAAKIRAINRGFADAEVVIDNGGILERIKTN